MSSDIDVTVREWDQIPDPAIHLDHLGLDDHFHGRRIKKSPEGVVLFELPKKGIPANQFDLHSTALS